jgi:hypothetical protein|tara:strand:- start:3459 stop:3827 length:369 start_codon:yes stop_codon:yes gene_type:complete
MATVYNFSATQGSQLSVRLNVKDASGDAINLSGYNARGVVKYRYSSTNSLVNLDPTIVSGTTGSAYQSGLIDVYLSGSQTSGLPVGQFVYDIEKYPSGASNTEGAVDKILAGDFFVYPQVTT